MELPCSPRNFQSCENQLVNFQVKIWEKVAKVQRRFFEDFLEVTVTNLLLVGNLYQSFTTVDLELVSIVHFTRFIGQEPDLDLYSVSSRPTQSKKLH